LNTKAFVINNQQQKGWKAQNLHTKAFVNNKKDERMKSLHIEIFVIKKQWRKSRNFGKEEEEEEEDHHHNNNNKAFSQKKRKKEKKVALVPTIVKSQVLTGEKGGGRTWLGGKFPDSQWNKAGGTQETEI
jgi:hypothetical protein